MIEQMRKLLLRRWILTTVTPFIFALTSQAAREFGVLEPLSAGIANWHPIVLLALAAGTGIALPMLYRVMFAYAHRGATWLSADVLYRYENNSIVAASLTPWCTLVATLLGAPDAIILGTLLLAIYAAYTQLPTTAKLTADARIFRVRI